MNTPIMVKTLNMKFQKMGFKNMTIKEDTSVKKLNKNFQKLGIGKKRKRESPILKKDAKKRKYRNVNVTDVVLYDKDFINNLFSVMDSIKKNRKYDINPDINPDIKMEDKHSVKLIPEYVYSKNDDNDNDIDIEYDSNVEIDGYASDEDIDLHNEDYYDDYDY
jgi:hypothetical protein